MNPTRHTRRRNRAGYTLVLFVMILFGLLALAALVIDVGFARLAQSEMQSATDTAALEGLRQLSSPVAGGDPAGADGYRRQQAAIMATEVFVDPSGAAQYGAGPVVNFSGGVGDPSLAASQLMEPGDPPVYQPSLQTNATNAINGDMVAGTYGANAAYDSTLTGDEDADYNRRDFTPSSGTASAIAPAFLVRMRRTNDPNGLDNEAGVSSAGPPLPFLFGHGSLLARSGASNELSVSSGMTVRATGIAGMQPAKTVGPLYANSGGTLAASPQLAPFALRSDVWASLAAAGGTASMTIDPLAAGSGAVNLDGQFRLAMTAIGQPIVSSSDEIALSAGPQPTAAYVAIYVDFGSQAGTIVGFVYYANWSFQNGNLMLAFASPAVKIGSQNVSPTIALSLPAALSPADAAAMFQAHAELFSQYPLYAPALVYRHLGANSP